MKKERFDKLMKLIAADTSLYSKHHVLVKDDFEVHTFGDPDNKSLDEAKTLFKQKGYKRDEVYVEARKLNQHNKLTNDYYRFLYDSKKDKISIGFVRVGFTYGSRKNRFYPFKTRIPILAWTKHMYQFTKTGSNKRSPRIQLGEIKLLRGSNKMTELIVKTLYNIDYIPTSWVSYRHFLNTKDEYEAIANYAGNTIPKALKHYPADSLLSLYKSLKDFTYTDHLRNYILKTHPKYQEKPYYLYDYELLADKLKYIYYDLFILLICGKITEDEYESIFTMSQSVDLENITIAQEIIKFKLEDGSN